MALKALTDVCQSLLDWLHTEVPGSCGHSPAKKGCPVCDGLFDQFIEKMRTDLRALCPDHERYTRGCEACSDRAVATLFLREELTRI